MSDYWLAFFTGFFMFANALIIGFVVMVAVF